MKNIKAQVATEYMILMGLVLLVTVPLLYWGMRESNVNVQLNHMNDAVNTLSRAADTVYSIGPGTRKYVWINMPSGVQSYSLSNKTVLMKIYVFGGLSDVFSETRADLAGIIPLSKGQHRIKVEMMESGYVQFGEANDTGAPVVIWTDPSGTINYNGIVIRATTNEYAVCKYDTSDTSYSSMSDNFVGSALTHEKDMGIFDNGTYTYFVRCQDPDGNVMDVSAIINFTIVPPGEPENGSLPPTNETYESDAPIITLFSPANNYTNNIGIVLFTYNVTDASSIWYCQLKTNTTTYDPDFTISKNTTQNFSIGGIDYGYYSWNITCSDVHGNINSSETRSFMMNYSQDYDVPVVDLVGPPDNTIRNYWLTKFSYIVNDTTSGIDYCELNMVGVMEDNGSVGWTIKDSPVAEGVTESITLPLFRANYTWNVSCVDDSYSANRGTSETWDLEINISAGEEAFLNSCAGYCGYIGYSEGECVQNCGGACDGICESGGDDWCTVGPPTPSCCCYY